MTGSPVGAIIRNINSYAQMRHRAELSGNVGGGYAVSSTLGARKPENKAWNDKNIEATREVAYTGDSDPDYVVEPTKEAELHFSGLMQKRSFAGGNVGGGYAVSSTLGARKPENKAWNDKNIEATHEVAYTGDSDPDYVVEPTAEAKLHNKDLFASKRSSLMQRRSRAHTRAYGNVGGGYAVSSTLGARKPENKALNDKNIEATH
jgi:hypothetical protein